MHSVISNFLYCVTSVLDGEAECVYYIEMETLVTLFAIKSQSGNLVEDDISLPVCVQIKYLIIHENLLSVMMDDSV